MRSRVNKARYVSLHKRQHKRQNRQRNPPPDRRLSSCSFPTPNFQYVIPHFHVHTGLPHSHIRIAPLSVPLRLPHNRISSKDLYTSAEHSHFVNMLRHAYRNRLSFGLQTVVSFRGGSTLARAGYSTVSGAGAGAGAGPTMPTTPSKAPGPPASDTPNKTQEPDPNTPTKTSDGNSAGHGHGRRGGHRRGRTVRSGDANGAGKGDWWKKAT